MRRSRSSPALIACVAALLPGPARAFQGAPENLDRSPFRWSPDGQFFTFHADWDGDEEIYVMRVDGTGIRQLTHNDRPDQRPSFSRDGRSILYESLVTRADSTADLDVMTIDRGTRESRWLFGVAGRHEFRPQELPDGRVGAALRVLPGGAIDIGVWDPVTDSITVIVSSPTYDGMPSWSDDGKIVFTSNRSGRREGRTFEVFVAGQDGNGVELIDLYPADREGAGASSASISLDGRRIVYSSDKEGQRAFDFEHWIYDVATGRDMRLPRAEGARLGVAAFSPDGRYISYPVDYDWDGIHQVGIMDLQTFTVVRNISVTSWGDPPQP